MLKLNKNRFARNRGRDREIGDIFNRTSSGINYALPFIITLFFTPVLITSSLFSKELIVMFANILLSTGYISSFGYHAYQKEVSKTELLISLLLIAAFIALTYYLSAPIFAFSLIKGLIFVNQAAAAINLFFIAKHLIVPPLKKIIRVAKYLGFDTSDTYYSKRPFDLEEDRFIIDKLLQQVYGHNSASPQYKKEEINTFNKLLKKLCQYINKYEEAFFGYISNKNAIVDIESQVMKLTTQGDPDSSYTFIRKKIGFKTTKITLLKNAHEEVLSALTNKEEDPKRIIRFFSNLGAQELITYREEVLTEGLNCFDEEIQRQKKKIIELEECLPIDRSQRSLG